MRLKYVDLLRAFAILLIVFEHSDHSSLLSMLSTSFSVPIFFIISGWLSKRKESLAAAPYFKRIAKRLLIPYFSLSLVLFLFWFFVGRHYGESAHAGYSPIKNFIGIFYGQGGAEYMNWGIPMWFLLALFCIYSIDFLVTKLRSGWQWIAVSLLVLIGYLLPKFIPYHLPWSIDVALSMYGFFFFGKVFGQKVDPKVTKFRWWFIPLALGLLALHACFFSFNGRVMYYYSNYGNFAFMYGFGIMGFLWAYLVFRFLSNMRSMAWLGRNTLPILAFHLLAMSVIKAVSLFILNHNLVLDAYSSLLLVFVQIALCVPVILFLNRFLPWMVGTGR